MGRAHRSERSRRLVKRASGCAATMNANLQPWHTARPAHGVNSNAMHCTLCPCSHSQGAKLPASRRTMRCGPSRPSRVVHSGGATRCGAGCSSGATAATHPWYAGAQHRCCAKGRGGCVVLTVPTVVLTGTRSCPDHTAVSHRRAARCGASLMCGMQITRPLTGPATTHGCSARAARQPGRTQRDPG